MLHYKRRCPLGNPVLIRTAKGEILVSETRLKMGSHLIFPRVLPIASPPPPSPLLHTIFRFLSNQPKSSEAWHHAADRVLLYLERYRDLGLQFGGGDNLVVTRDEQLPSLRYETIQ